MGLAQSDAAVEEEGVEALAGGLSGDAAGAGVRHLVRFADDEGIECETRVERRRDVLARIRFFLGLDTGFFRFGDGFGGSFHHQAGWIADAEIDTAHRGAFRLPQRGDAGSVMIAHPVADETCRQRDGDLIAFRSRQGHWPQPVAIFSVSQFRLQQAANSGPCHGELRFFHVISLLEELSEPVTAQCL